MTEQSKASDLDAVANNKWYTFSRRKGIYFLGMMVAIVSVAYYAKQPSRELYYDTKGAAAYIQCAGSLIEKNVDESICRAYFDQYLRYRIEVTENLPKIVPIKTIQSTYAATVKAFEEKGYEALPPLADITMGKIK